MTANVMKMLQEKEVKFVDLRFTDTRGKEQHVSLPAGLIDEDFFRDGKMFDGSSIAGWKGIEASDMVLMPEAATAVMDPFADENTLIIRCDILEPATMQGYERDPTFRRQARRGLPQVHRYRGHRLLRPRARVLRPRRRPLGQRHHRLLL